MPNPSNVEMTTDVLIYVSINVDFKPKINVGIDVGTGIAYKFK